jgi:secreted trypsin-like serine protease
MLGDVRRSALVFTLAVGGCTGAPGVGVVGQPIIGGTTDTADPSVVLLYVTVPGQSGGALCTGEVISPHVVLTAAHCAGGDDPSVTNALYHVYLGDDFGNAHLADLIRAKEAHYHPQFDANNLTAGNDVGVIIMNDALAVTPLPYNHASMNTGFDGGTVRFVGYGLDNATAQTGGGVKRATSTTLTDHTDLLLHFSDGTHETCNGDSGGPAFMSIGGRETIVGLTSYGDVACADGGWDTRVDALAAWIDGWVAQFDSGTPPSPSGGTQSPPTSSATPMPPSSTGAGGVGASCVSPGDCPGSEVHGGCAIGGDAGGDAAAFMLVMLALGMARARRRA